jgi:hypothetical protein
MQNVKVKEGLNFSKKISGIFPLVKEFIPDSNSKKQGFVWVTVEGKTKRLAVNAADVTPVAKRAPSKAEQAALAQMINDRFLTLEILINAAVDGKLRAVAVSGAAGIGKSYAVEKAIDHLKDTARLTIMRGHSSGLGLYERLYNARHRDSILVLDDIDSIFADDASLNLLKGALDTTGDRIVGWFTDSSFLRQQEIPNHFHFSGTVIFLTNLDFDTIIASGNRLASTVGALISRTTYLNLKVHSSEEIMIRIRQLVKNGKMIKSTNAPIIMAWLEKNHPHLRYLSLRSVLQVEKLMEIAPKDWERIAKNTMFIS